MMHALLALTQVIPIASGLTLTYVHRNFDRNRDDEFRTWVVRASDSESVWNAAWVADPCPGPEDHMSRREQAGAREMGGRNHLSAPASPATPGA